MKNIVAAMGGAVLLAAAPAHGQSVGGAGGEGGESAFDGDYLSIGIGAAYGPSYDGSDDYVVSPAPILQGSFRGVDINPRAAGLALDFIQDGDGTVGFDLGVAGRVRMNRARQIEDEVVKSLGELDTAIEFGPSAGISFSQLLNPYDSLTISGDALWDVAGAHDGMTLNPTISYFTPFSRGMAGSLSFSAEYADDDFADYYYSITPAQEAASGLPAFQADKGFTRAGATLLLAVDLDGDLQNGGFSLVGIGSYSRMLGDAKDSPITSIRGSADQWMGALGIGYTF
ncbi:outer membrane scaffolding protein for murein synthesis (MipA/OmpV family) [Altererythrobacter atlanticus]|uniref:MltA-interacting protein MipA n=1 Tax=Croceibacterium atlanticum TaxID=1267766 RepID=A0A0F7KXU9_9SPHN|nr:MipA/OmpV family protein [Croceibacterium atlanticum]AKH44042.1 MltA-interacting protein MipA [Croceibacterium atlanticum]MBB5732349.1 outer membrane scaffolding protein for murein synthesis (MipA/OmpV family) [Croceibacterium atlanticum]